MKTKSTPILSTTFAVLILAGSGQAAPITVENHSFETGPATAGSNGNLARAPWRNPAPSADDNLIEMQLLSALGTSVTASPDGSAYAHYTNSSAQSVYQVLAATLQANTTYTLRVDVGDRTNTVAQPGSIRLGYVVNNNYASDFDYGTNLLTATVVNDTVPVKTSTSSTDGWETWESTFTTGASPAGLGQPLRIELVTAAGVQTLWDNVRLDTGSISEPAAVVKVTDFTYDPGDGSAEVSIAGAANTNYKLVEADDLDFSNPDQDPIPLTGATVGTQDGNEVTTDGSGNATVQFNLGNAKSATFLRAEETP